MAKKRQKAPKLVPLRYGSVQCEACREEISAGMLGDNQRRRPSLPNVVVDAEADVPVREGRGYEPQPSATFLIRLRTNGFGRT
jgi:hypothetical protein